MSFILFLYFHLFHISSHLEFYCISICVLADDPSDGWPAGEQRPHPEEEAPDVPERAAHVRREPTDPGEHQALHRRAGGIRKVCWKS